MDRVQAMLYGVIVGFVFMLFQIPSIELIEDIHDELEWLFHFAGAVSAAVFGIPLLVRAYKALFR